MAVDLSRQGGGIGRAVLAAAIEAARDAGAPLIWANARTTAIAFYESAGFVALGEGYLTAETRLPHKKIVLPLD
jgi:GNAT superfamily N-acetyltransferase